MVKGLGIGPENLKEKWGVLQESGKDFEETGLKQERSFVKEGKCEECGALGVLSKFGDCFMCGGCIKLSERSDSAKAKPKRKRKSS